MKRRIDRNPIIPKLKIPSIKRLFPEIFFHKKTSEITIKREITIMVARANDKKTPKRKNIKRKTYRRSFF